MTSSNQYLITFGPHSNCTFQVRSNILTKPRYLESTNSFFQLCTIEQTVYGYRPSLPANVTFAGLFSLAMIVHIILGLRWKMPWFMWCMILGCLHEVTGYVGRIIMWNNPWSFAGFIIQISISPKNVSNYHKFSKLTRLIVCITQAPVFYCAAIYVTLGKA